MSNRKRWNLWMDEPLLADLKQLSDRKGVPASEIVRIACTKYLAAVKKAELAAKEAAQTPPERVDG